MVEEEGADPDVRGTTGVRQHQRMDWQPALYEHQASPGSSDLETRGKLTPEWPSTVGMTRTTTTTTTITSTNTM